MWGTRTTSTLSSPRSWRSRRLRPPALPARKQPARSLPAAPSPARRHLERARRVLVVRCLLHLESLRCLLLLLPPPPPRQSSAPTRPSSSRWVVFNPAPLPSFPHSLHLSHPLIPLHLHLVVILLLLLLAHWRSNLVSSTRHATARHSSMCFEFVCTLCSCRVLFLLGCP